jgi:hypothetical protein
MALGLLRPSALRFPRLLPGLGLSIRCCLGSGFKLSFSGADLLKPRLLVRHLSWRLVPALVLAEGLVLLRVRRFGGGQPAVHLGPEAPPRAFSCARGSWPYASRHWP